MPIAIPKTTAFSRAATSLKARQRLIVSVDGLEKSGKSHFALSGPRPLGYIDFDEGLEGVAQKFPLDDVFVSSLGAQFSKASTMAIEGHAVEKVAKAANEVWAQFRKDFIWGLDNLRGLVVDTGTEMHELIRLARFGKLTQVMPEMYGPVYGELSSLIKRAYSSDCSLIILHRLKPEYEQVAEKTSTGKRQPGRKTGRLIRAGFKDIGFLVQATVKLDKDDDGFSCTIEHCRHNPKLEGVELPQEIISFPTLAQMIFTDTMIEDWK